MATGLRLIFWGLVLVLVDVRLDTFDVLADAAGYVLVAVGAGRLAGVAAGFRTARLATWAMAVPGLADTVVPLQAHPVWGTLAILGDAWLLWALLTGISAWTAAEGRPDFAGRARRCRAASLALLAAALPLGFLARGGGGLGRSDTGGLAVILLVLTLVLMAFVLRLIHRVRAELEPETSLHLAPRPVA